MPSTIQFRLDSSLSEKIKQQAARENISTNKLLIQAITQHLEAEKEREWRAGFDAMGRDPNTNSVEYMLPLAREVTFADE